VSASTGCCVDWGEIDEEEAEEEEEEEIKEADDCISKVS
jgi:hypothetical protein